VPGAEKGPLPGLPLFVVTHDVPEPVPQGESRYSFVTDGVESAIERAKAAAGDKYVSLMGASIPRQCLRAGLLDEIQIHLVPVLLGAGVRLFDHLGSENIELETIQVVDSPRCHAPEVPGPQVVMARSGEGIDFRTLPAAAL
jgi:dihydrofolate reductase